MSPVELNLGDVVVAVKEWLADGADLAEASEGRIFGHELPDSEAESMPRPCVVVHDAGGYVDDLPEAMDRARIDVKAYGATRDQAKSMAVLVALRMRELTRATRNDVVISGAKRAGGYIPLTEPIGAWPGVLRSYFVPYAHRGGSV